MPNSQPGNQAEAAEPPARRSTFRSSMTFDSLRRRKMSATVDLQKGPFQEYYPCYEGLPWEALKGYLERKWPAIKLVERKELDLWLFEIPERLTEQDRNNIAALRDSNQAPRRRAVTPEN